MWNNNNKNTEKTTRITLYASAFFRSVRDRKKDLLKSIMGDIKAGINISRYLNFDGPGPTPKFGTIFDFSTYDDMLLKEYSVIIILKYNFDHKIQEIQEIQEASAKGGFIVHIKQPNNTFKPIIINNDNDVKPKSNEFFFEKIIKLNQLNMKIKLSENLVGSFNHNMQALEKLKNQHGMGKKEIEKFLLQSKKIYSKIMINLKKEKDFQDALSENSAYYDVEFKFN